MSTLGDVIGNASGFIEAFDRLLATKTARQAPAIARDLGAEPQFGAAIGKASTVVGQASHWVDAAFLAAVLADAAIAVFGLLPTLVHGAGQALQNEADEARNVGLDVVALRGVADDVNKSVGQVATLLEVSVDTAEKALAFIDPPSLSSLRDSLAKLAQRLDDLTKLPPDTAAA